MKLDFLKKIRDKKNHQTKKKEKKYNSRDVADYPVKLLTQLIDSTRFNDFSY